MLGFDGTETAIPKPFVFLFCFLEKIIRRNFPGKINAMKLKKVKLKWNAWKVLKWQRFLLKMAKNAEILFLFFFFDSISVCFLVSSFFFFFFFQLKRPLLFFLCLFYESQNVNIFYDFLFIFTFLTNVWRHGLTWLKILNPLGLAAGIDLGYMSVFFSENLGSIRNM